MSSSPFPKILHIGDKQIQDLFDGPIEITEKLDGSQLGFGKINNRLFIRSKGREIDTDNPDGMFIDAVEYIKSIEQKIPDNHTFYGEYLQKPKHNTLAYDRIPRNHIALFGVCNYETKEFLDYDTISKWADTFEVDAIPRLATGDSSPSAVIEMVKNKVSYLGGQNIEGVVVKAYKPWMFLGQIPLTVMSGKYVTEEFKEVHIKNWKSENTNKGQLEKAVEQFKTEARWNKAIQHLKERGELLGAPQDIGKLFKEVRIDVETEEKENIKEILYKIYREKFLKQATLGMPEWYKQKLVLGEIDGEVQKPEKSKELYKESQQQDSQEG